MSRVAPLTAGDLVSPRHRVTSLVARGDVFDVYGAWDLDRDCPCVVKTVAADRRDGSGVYGS